MGRYIIDRIFAEGAQGRLYRAQDKITNQVCILKTGHSIKKEALLALELNHPYIARPFDFGVDPEMGTYAAYPEYTDPSLLEWAERKPKENDLRRVAVQIAEFLAFIHHRGWLYNDFKPGHFLISEKDIRVLDLGLCSRIEESSGTFSGTFPYIAPERLAGRPSDVRSDIFAFGMLLLHTLVPSENWNYEPSIAVLQDLQKRTEQLPRYWKELLSEMISLEASQRMESAVELWNQLLPSSQGNFLFFPFPSCFSICASIEEEPSLIVRSDSTIALAEVENKVLLHNWRKEVQTIIYDLQNIGIEDCFDSLCNIFSDQTSSDFFSAVEFLCSLQPKPNSLLIFRRPEILSSNQKALFSYALSSLLRKSHFNILITTNGNQTGLNEDLFKSLDLPALTKQNLDQILPLLFPANENSEKIIKSFQDHDFTIPEQLLNEIRKHLVPQQFVIWPAAAREYSSTSVVHGLRPVERHLLAGLTIAGGSVHKSILLSAFNLTVVQGDVILDKLESGGYVKRQQGDQYFSNTPIKIVLSGLRKDTIQKIAESLLRVWPKDHGQEMAYRIAIFSKNQRAAAFFALSVARSLTRSSKSRAAGDWYWKAFSSNAKLPKRTTLKLIHYCLFRVQSWRVRKLLIHAKKTFGKSFRLMRITLDLFHRMTTYKDAIHLSQLGITIATRRADRLALDYFSVRLAGFLILDFRLDEGERIIANLLKHKSKLPNENILGLSYHFLGLSYLYGGKFEAAIEAIKIATSNKHQYQTSSLMNLGVAYVRLGKPEIAERVLRKAVAIFIRRNDFDRLCFAYTNLGIAIKQQGRVKEARSHYFHALRLSYVCKNHNIRIPALTNIAITYESEGRTSYAIRAHSKVVKLAKRNGYRVQMAIALINVATQYSIIGKYRSAVARLTHALELVRELDLQFEVGSAFESLGFAYLLSRRYRKAVESFTQAVAYFSKAGAPKDLKRSEIFVALALAEHGDEVRSREILNSSIIDKDSFEEGLRKYALAYSALTFSHAVANECRDWIHQSEVIFRKVPNLFWLGRLEKLKAKYYLEEDHLEKASISIQSAYNIFTRLGAKEELTHLSKEVSNTELPTDFLNEVAGRLPYKVLLMIEEIFSEPDLDNMISKILSTSLKLTDMERAVLILDGNPRKMFESSPVDESTAKEIRDICTSAIDQVRNTRKCYVRLDAACDPYLKNKPSILANRIMSIVCLPLRVNDRTIGILYLDSKDGVETVPSSETVLLETFGQIISANLLNWLDLQNSDEENKKLRGLLKRPSERTLKEIEREIIQKRLEEHNWNIVRTAATLGLTRHGLYSKIRLYKIERRSKPESKALARSIEDQFRRPTRAKR